MKDNKQPLQFDLAVLDNLGEKELAMLVGKVVHDHKHAPALRSMMKSMVRSVLNSPARLKEK
jgi:hypothetical protein